MSKRLFILGSLLETRPGRAPTKARMGTPVVVEPEIGAQRGGPAGGAAIGRAVGPFAQQGLDQRSALPLVCGAVGSGEAVAHAPPGQTPARMGAIAPRVVGEQPSYRSRRGGETSPASAGETPHRPAAPWPADFDIGHPRRIVDRDVHVLVADAPRAGADDPRACDGRSPTIRPSGLMSRCSRSPARGHSYR